MIAQRRADGSVEVFAQGEEEKMKEFEEWCKTGPEMAKVENVATRKGSFEEQKGFDIRY